MEAALVEATKAEALRAEALRVEAARVEVVRAEATRAEATRAEATRADILGDRSSQDPHPTEFAPDSLCPPHTPFYHKRKNSHSCFLFAFPPAQCLCRTADWVRGCVTEAVELVSGVGGGGVN